MKLLSILLVFILSHIACDFINNDDSEEIPLTVEVEFPFPVSNVELHLWSPFNRIIKMDKINPLFFSTNLTGSPNELLFNVKYDIPYYGLRNYWVASGNTYLDNLVPNRFDAHGLKYAEITINGQKIDNRYTVLNSSVDGLNISLMFNRDNSVAPFYNSSRIHMLVDDKIPEEVPHRYAYCNKNLPFPYHSGITGWITVLHNDDSLKQTQIMVDDISLYARIGTNLMLLARNDYNIFNPQNDGGLYLRYPFFPPGDKHDPMYGIISEGIFAFVPSSNPNKVWHFWSPRFSSYSGFEFDSYRVECRLRIEGNSIVQAGIDFRDNSNNISELGASDWYFDNNGIWQTVIFDSQDFK